MIISLNNNAPIIGMDHSYYDVKQKKITIYFKSLHSMIVAPSFLELMSMMNGLFDRNSILSYAEKALSYDKKYVSDVLDEMISWGVACESRGVCLWNTSLNKEYSEKSFGRFDVRFLSVTPALIDLAFLLCKYNFNSISFLDSDVKIESVHVETSVLLQESDKGRLLCELIESRRSGNKALSVGEHHSLDAGQETIFVCDGHSDIYSRDYSILLDADDYRKNSNFCRELAFKMSNAETQSDAKFIEFENILKTESDVIFGVVDGFYE